MTRYRIMNLIKYLAVFAAGFVCASVFFVVRVFPQIERDKFEFGFNTGHTDGVIYAAHKLAREFGFIESNAPGKILFGAKMIDVVLIEVDGVKTVRVSK